MTTIGIILDERGDPPFHSVSKLWKGTVDGLDACFDIRVFPVSSFEVDCHAPSFRAFVADVDLIFLLSPYYAIDRTVADRPLVAYALGSLAKGGHWLRHNAASFRPSDSLIVSSMSCQRIFESVALAPAMSVHRVPFGVDPTIYRPRDKRAMRERHGLPRDKRILVYSGRISPQKNCALILDLFATVRRRHEDLHLVFVGDRDDFVVPDLTPHPSDRATFDQRLAEIGTDVTLVDHQQDPVSHAQILAAADLGLNLTTAPGENYGFTQVEYQMVGLPVVCTDYGGLRDTVLHGATGLRVDTTLTIDGVRVDLDQAVAYADRLLSDPDLAERFARQARAHANSLSIRTFEEGLQRTIDRTLARNVERLPLTAHMAPVMEELHAVLAAARDNVRGVDQEHLHPRLHFRSYRHVMSQVVTRVDSSAATDAPEPVPSSF